MLLAKTYVMLVPALCAGFLVPAAALNLMISIPAHDTSRNRLASEWQQSTRGVTYAPPISQNRPFKTLRLTDRIAEIDTVIFGSSTTMGIPGDAFPPPLAAYNFAQSGNGLATVIGEAEYVAERWPGRVKLFVIPLDWALGFVYGGGEPLRVDLSAEAVLREAAAARPSPPALLADALSLPRLKILARVAREVLRAPDAAAAFRQVFLEPAGPEYRCPDGTPARDFDVTYQGTCNGFRYDGSATFADQKRVEAARAEGLLAAAVSGSSQYAAALRSGGGRLNPAYLERLAHFARRVQGAGGKLILLLPPLMPGMEQALAATVHSGGPLRQTREALEAWAGRERLTLLDAGRSERFGCAATEFIDPHHALPECYRKVFSRFFDSQPRAPGAAANR